MNSASRRINALLLGFMVALPTAAIFYAAQTAANLPFLPADIMNWLIPYIPGDLITLGIDIMVDAILAFDLGREDTTAKFFETLMAAGLFAGILALVAAIYQNSMFGIYNKYLPSPAGGLILGILIGLPLALLSNIQLTGDNPFYDGRSFEIRTAWIVGLIVVWGLVFHVLFERLLSIEDSEPESPSTPAEAAPAPVATTATPAPAESSGPGPVTVPVTRATVQQLSRRQFLIQVGGTTAAVTLAGAGLGSLLDEGEQIIAAEQINFSFADFPNANSAVIPAPGTRPEYTPIDNHYRIDISSANPPAINGDEWRLKISGLVDNPTDFSLDQLQNDFTPVNQYVTLSCISNRIAGSLISTTGWTGVSMQDILEIVQPQESATHIRITSADGFWEYLSLDDIRQDERIMLSYAWNEELLRVKHGFPLRIYIPDLYGMKQPKWITEIEFVEEWAPGYWVERGWSRTAIVQTTSVVDTIAVDDRYDIDGQTFIPIGGIAYAGARGISRVEVSVNDGEWVEAELREPLSDTTWALWRYDWPMEKGEFTFAVRAYEGDGTIQTDRVRSTRPSGATGIHSLSADV